MESRASSRARIDPLRFNRRCPRVRRCPTKLGDLRVCSGTNALHGLGRAAGQRTASGNRVRRSQRRVGGFGWRIGCFAREPSGHSMTIRPHAETDPGRNLGLTCPRHSSIINTHAGSARRLDQKQSHLHLTAATPNRREKWPCAFLVVIAGYAAALARGAPAFACRGHSPRSAL